MTMLATRPLTDNSPERMAIVTESGQYDWRNFAINSLMVFEGLRSGHQQLFEDDAVIDTIVGVGDFSVLCPGRLMSAMYGRGYRVATSALADYESLAAKTAEIVEDPSAGEELTIAEMQYMRANARITKGMLNEGLDAHLNEMLEHDKPMEIATAFVNSGWAVMLMSLSDETSHAFYPRRGELAQPSSRIPGNAAEFILHAVKHQVY